MLIDVAISEDGNMTKKETRIFQNIQDFTTEIQRM
jgi:hypothetical protein